MHAASEGDRPKTMTSRRRPVACTYCSRPADTLDYVPPRCLFGPRPSALVKVPSCLRCNQGASADDEYFRLMVALRHDVDDPDCRFVRAAAMRSLRRPRARGLRTSLLATMREVELRTPAGLYLGRRVSTYSPETDRLLRVVRRTMLGLFYRDLGHRLPEEYETKVYLPSAVDRGSEGGEEGFDLLLQMAATLRRKLPRFVGRPVLTYWRSSTTEDPDATAWLLVFYERVAFMGITLRPSG
jgi:hypothetical protein